MLTIIAAIILGLAYPQVVSAERPPDLLGVLAVVLAAGVGARFLFDRAARQARERGAHPAPLLIRTAQVLRTAIVGAYALVVYGFHWPALVQELSISGYVLVDEALILAPFFVMLLLLHLASYSAEADLGMHGFKRGEYLAFQGRQYLLPLLPIAFYVLVGDLVGVGIRGGVRWVAELNILTASYDFVLWLMLAVTLLIAWCAIPFLLRWVWRCRPLSAGPLRERLEEFSRREGFKARDILVMPTGENVLNAAVIGLAGPFRYVLLTDALISGLDQDEVEAVFAHEVGHAKHNHMLLYFLFTLGYALLTFFVGSALEGRIATWIGHREVAYLLLVLGAFLLWFGILFGFVSRRFEQQADVYGALATGRVRGDGTAEPDPREHPFVRALEGLSAQMGDIREVKGWRHFSLGERISFLLRFLASDEVRRRYRRRMTALLVFFIGLLAALGVAAAATVPNQLRSGRIRASYARVGWLRSQERHQEAAWERLRADRLAREAGLEVIDHRDLARRSHELTQSEDISPAVRASAHAQLAAAYRALGMNAAARDALTDGIREFGDHPLLPVFLVMLGETLLSEGRTGGARLAFEDALALPPPGEDFRPYVRRRLRELSEIP
ncbi:MAG: M48 family metalloprotease [Planctomycetota bacterium]